MLNKQMKKIIDYLKNDEGNNKKKIENLAFFVIILIITIIVINMLLKDDKKNNQIEKTNTTKTLAKTENTNTKTYTDKSYNCDNENNVYENELENNLENILSKIDGVGKVSVMITYSQTSQIVALYNEDSTSNNTEEKDSRWR